MSLEVPIGYIKEIAGPAMFGKLRCQQSLFSRTGIRNSCDRSETRGSAYGAEGTLNIRWSCKHKKQKVVRKQHGQVLQPATFPSERRGGASP